MRFSKTFTQLQRSWDYAVKAQSRSFENTAFKSSLASSFGENISVCKQASMI